MPDQTTPSAHRLDDEVSSSSGCSCCKVHRGTPIVVNVYNPVPAHTADVVEASIKQARMMGL